MPGTHTTFSLRVCSPRSEAMIIIVPTVSWEMLEAAARAQYREWIREFRQQTPGA